jgi:triosephosphate isomerase
MRKKIVAANWKMNKTVAEAAAFVENFLHEIQGELRVDIVLLPPFTALAKVSEMLGSTQNVKLGAQNMHFQTAGAFTGEISASMLRALFVRFVVLGHSERRQLFGETDALVNRKLHTAHAALMTPILCIGETLEQRDAGQVETVLASQLRGALDGLTDKQVQETIIAYEPVWAIGTGRNATPDQAQEAHAFIRRTVGELASADAARRIRIQYGGSVKPSNAQDLMRMPDIDGALVGGASLEPRDFALIVKGALRAAGAADAD